MNRLYLLLADRFFNASFAEKVQTMLDHSWVIDWPHADGALEVFGDGLDVGNLPLERGGRLSDNAGFFANLGHDIIVQLLVSLVHNVHHLRSASALRF